MYRSLQCWVPDLRTSPAGPSPPLHHQGKPQRSISSLWLPHLTCLKPASLRPYSNTVTQGQTLNRSLPPSTCIWHIHTFTFQKAPWGLIFDFPQTAIIVSWAQSYLEQVLRCPGDLSEEADDRSSQSDAWFIVIIQLSVDSGWLGDLQLTTTESEPSLCHSASHTPI